MLVSVRWFLFLSFRSRPPEFTFFTPSGDLSRSDKGEKRWSMIPDHPRINRFPRWSNSDHDFLRCYVVNEGVMVRLSIGMTVDNNWKLISNYLTVWRKKWVINYIFPVRIKHRSKKKKPKHRWSNYISLRVNILNIEFNSKQYLN